jgi:hypothetical protein
MIHNEYFFIKYAKTPFLKIGHQKVQNKLKIIKHK